MCRCGSSDYSYADRYYADTISIHIRHRFSCCCYERSRPERLHDRREHEYLKDDLYEKYNEVRNLRGVIQKLEDKIDFLKGHHRDELDSMRGRHKDEIYSINGHHQDDIEKYRKQLAAALAEAQAKENTLQQERKKKKQVGDDMADYFGWHH